MPVNSVIESLLSNIQDQIEYGTDTLVTKSQKTIFDPFDSFDVVDEQEDVNSIMRIRQSSKHQNKSICVDCNQPMQKNLDKMIYFCEFCGLEENLIGNEVDSTTNEGGVVAVNNYNTSDTSAAPIRITGPNNYMYQKKLVSTTSNYKKTQKKNTADQMSNIVYQFKGSIPPKSVVQEAADLYYSVQQHCIKRGDVRKGTMAACLYRKCIEHSISRKPKEISDIFGIPQSELSNGEKIIDDLVARGLIKVKEAPISDGIFDEIKMLAFLNRYFESLNIPNDEIDNDPVGRPNYKRFACTLIRFTQKYKIANSSIMSSKCAGTIYIMSSKRKELNIKRSQIEKECAISKSTFSRFAKAVHDVLADEDPTTAKVRSRMRKIFKKNQIPLA